MDEEVFELAKEQDLNLDEAQQLQEVIDDTGLDADDALPAESLMIVEWEY